MAKCDVCGNEYDKSFKVSGPRGEGTFDAFECAIHKLAPSCEHCGSKIIGHGVEVGDSIYCCASCARHAGDEGARDRVP